MKTNYFSFWIWITLGNLFPPQSEKTLTVITNGLTNEIIATQKGSTEEPKQRAKEYCNVQNISWWNHIFDRAWLFVPKLNQLRRFLKDSGRQKTILISNSSFSRLCFHNSTGIRYSCHGRETEAVENVLSALFQKHHRDGKEVDFWRLIPCLHGCLP